MGGKKPDGETAELDFTAWITEFNFVNKYVYYLQHLNNSNFTSWLPSKVFIRISQVSSEGKEQYSSFGYILAHTLTHSLFSVLLIVSGGYSTFYLP